MTIFPQNLSKFPTLHTNFPFHFKINCIERGYPSHRHNFLEFSYVIEGQGSEMINGVLHEMKPGTFTFVLPYQIHQIFTDKGSPLRLFNCMFEMDILYDMNSDMGVKGILLETGDHLPPYIHFDDGQRPHMENLLNELYDEFNQEGHWQKALIRAKLMEILIRFDRLRRSRKLKNSDLTKPNGTYMQNKMWRVVNYVHRHYQEEITLSGIAEHFHFSPSHLSESFKRCIGKNFLDFVHELRIRHACGLLSSTEMNISDIAMEVGYGSYKTFSRVFRIKKGMTPQNYKKGEF